MHLVDLLVGCAEPLLQPLEHRARGRAGDLEPHDVAEAAAAQLVLDRLEQVVGLVRDLEVGVAGDPEHRALHDLHAGEEPVEEVGDHALERQQPAVRAGREEARQPFRHLHAGEALLAALRVAREHPEAEGQARDVREALPGADAERRQHGEDLAVEAVLEHAQLVGIEVAHRRDRDPLLRERGGERLLPELRLLRGQLEDALADACQRVPWRQPVDGPNRDPGRRLAHQPGHAHHEELVQVRGDEAAHLHALEQRQRVVGDEVEQPRVVLERRELPVQQAVGSFPLGRRGHPPSIAQIVVTRGLGTGEPH